MTATATATWEEDEALVELLLEAGAPTTTDIVGLDRTTAFRKVVLEARRDFNELDRQAARRLFQILKELHTKISAGIVASALPNGKLPHPSEVIRLASLEEHLTAFREQYDQYLRGYTFESAANAVGREQALANVYASYLPADLGNRVRALSTTFGTVPTEALNAIYQRVARDGLTLSAKVWRLETIARRQIENQVVSAVASGKSAVALSKDLEKYLVTRGPAWTTRITRSSTGRGTLSYNALRLARSTINNAHREGHIRTIDRIKKSKVNYVVGVKWNRSTTFYECPTCETWAIQDLYKLGNGGYPPDKVPVEHPNGRCYTTTIFLPPHKLAGKVKDRDLRRLLGITGRRAAASKIRREARQEAVEAAGKASLAQTAPAEAGVLEAIGADTTLGDLTTLMAGQKDLGARTMLVDRYLSEVHGIESAFRFTHTSDKHLSALSWVQETPARMRALKIGGGRLAKMTAKELDTVGAYYHAWAREQLASRSSRLSTIRKAAGADPKATVAWKGERVPISDFLGMRAEVAFRELVDAKVGLAVRMDQAPEAVRLILRTHRARIVLDESKWTEVGEGALGHYRMRSLRGAKNVHTARADIHIGAESWSGRAATELVDDSFNYTLIHETSHLHHESLFFQAIQDGDGVLAEALGDFLGQSWQFAPNAAGAGQPFGALFHAAVVNDYGKPLDLDVLRWIATVGDGAARTGIGAFRRHAGITGTDRSGVLHFLHDITNRKIYGTGAPFVTPYAESNAMEDFAESMTAFLLNAARADLELGKAKAAAIARLAQWYTSGEAGRRVRTGTKAKAKEAAVRRVTVKLTNLQRSALEGMVGQGTMSRAAVLDHLIANGSRSPGATLRSLIRRDLVKLDRGGYVLTELGESAL